MCYLKKGVNTYGSVERRIGGFPLPEEKREREARNQKKIHRVFYRYVINNSRTLCITWLKDTSEIWEILLNLLITLFSRS